MDISDQRQGSLDSADHKWDNEEWMAGEQLGARKLSISLEEIMTSLIDQSGFKNKQNVGRSRIRSTGNGDIIREDSTELEYNMEQGSRHKSQATSKGRARGPVVTFGLMGDSCSHVTTMDTNGLGGSSDAKSGYTNGIDAVPATYMGKNGTAHKKPRQKLSPPMEKRLRFSRRRSVSESNLANIPIDIHEPMGEQIFEDESEEDEEDEEHFYTSTPRQISSSSGGKPPARFDACTSPLLQRVQQGINSNKTIEHSQSQFIPQLPSSQAYSQSHVPSAHYKVVADSLARDKTVDSHASQAGKKAKSGSGMSPDAVKKSLESQPYTRYTMDKYGNVYGPFIIQPGSPGEQEEHKGRATKDGEKLLSKDDKKKSSASSSAKNPRVGKIKKTALGGSLEDMARKNLMFKR